MPASFELTSSTFGEFLQHHFEKSPGAFLGDPLLNKSLNFSDFFQSVKHVATLMKNEGLPPNSVVHFIGTNSLELMVCYCAIALNDWIPVGSNSKAPVVELEVNVNNTFSKALLVSKELWTVFGKEFSSNTLKVVFVYELLHKDPFEIAIKKVHYSNPFETPQTITDELKSVSFMFLTSGSTGSPKAVKINHRTIFATDGGCYYLLLEFFNIRRTILQCQPFSHAGGIFFFLIALFSGQNLYMMEGFDEKRYLDAITKYHVNCLFTTITMITSISKYAGLSDYDLSEINLIVSGGATLNKESIDAVQEKANVSNKLIFVENYGSSETGFNYFSSNYLNDIKPGLPLSSSKTHAKIMSVDSQQECYEGEIWIKYSGLMLGYLNDKVKTDAALTKDGWYKTGDLGYIKDGNLFISGRIKDVIKYRAFSVNSLELEKVMLTHPDVKNVGVIAEPHDEHGEIPVAFVVASSQVSAGELMIYVSKRVSEYKQIRKVYFIEKIPYNNGNKIDKVFLRNHLKNISG